MSDPIIELTEENKIAFSLPVLWTGLSALIGLAMWLTVIFYTANANSASISKMEKYFQSIDRRLATIEGYILRTKKD